MHIVSRSEDITHAPMRAPFARWGLLRRSGALPSVEAWLAEEDPLAAYRMIATIQRAPLNVQYEKAGAALERLYGKPLAGKNLKMLYNAWFRKRAYQGYEMMLKHSGAVYEQHTINMLVKKIGYYKLHLPLGGQQITHAVTYIIPNDSNLKTRGDWEVAAKETPWL